MPGSVRDRRDADPSRFPARNATTNAVLVRLLGPFVVERDGVPVRPNRRPAVVLALLALRLGSWVPFPVIHDVVWPDGDLPADPRRTIQTYASRLREVLGKSAISSGDGGLRLELARDQIDLWQFRDLVSAAEGADELARLTEALELWRGAPLSGLNPDTLERTHGGVLVEDLLDATERANELRLRRDSLDEVQIGELRRLVAEHPWRERSWGHLMLALYRNGRTGDALATFHELVTVLRDDLGIDPGHEVTRLHQRMLARDPSLLGTTDTTGEHRSSAPQALVPAQLPATVATFVGRARELTEVVDTLVNAPTGPRLVVISGPAGFGKTTTAIEAAYRVADAFPDGQLFATGWAAGRPIPPDELLVRFLRDLGVAAAEVPASSSERATLYRSICARRRVLVVVDAASDAQQVAALVPGAGRSALVVTSRRRLAGLGGHEVDLGVLSQTEAHELLASCVDAARLDEEPEATMEIVQACGGSPLALHIVGGRLAVRPQWSLAYVAARLQGPEPLAAMGVGKAAVRRALDASTVGLEADQEARFRELAAIPVDLVDTQSAAALWACDITTAEQTLEDLGDARLLTPEAPGVYTWHRLVGRFLRDGVEPDEEAQRRVVRHGIASLANAKRRLRPDDRPEHPVISSIVDAGGLTFRDRGEIHAWVHARAPLFVGLARAGMAGPDKDHAVEAAALGTLLDVASSECCRPHEITEGMLRDIVEADLAPSGRHFVAAAWHNLGVLYSDRGRFDQAHDAELQALALWRELGDRYGEFAILNNFALLHGRMGDQRRESEILRTCVEGADGFLPASLHARAMVNLARVLALVGPIDEACQWFEAARARYVPPPDSADAHQFALVEGQIHEAAGDFAAAVEAVEVAFAAAEQVDSPRLRAQALVALARSRRLAGLDSLPSATQCVHILSAHAVIDPPTQAEALVETGHVYRMTGELEHARACAAEARRVLVSASVITEKVVALEAAIDADRRP